MGIFDIDKKDDEIAQPNKKDGKETSGVKQEEIKKMSGFSDISGVVKHSPSVASDSISTGSSGNSRRVSSREKAKIKEQAEQDAKLEKRRRAIQTLGKRYAKWLAENPYKLWAAFADDDRLKLTVEEAQELSEMYFELAEALEPDLTAWYIIALGIAAQNSSLVIERLKYINEMEKTDEELKKPKLETKERVSPVQ